MIEYRIESDWNAEYLASTIQQATNNDNWKLQGGISVVQSVVGREFRYTQALVREVPHDEGMFYK